MFYADYITKTLVANGVTLGLAGSFATTQVAAMSLGQVIKGLLATPMGMITAMTAAVLGLGAIVTHFTDNWQKEVKTAQDALKTNKVYHNDDKNARSICFKS
ncbi:MAG: hypothetical protein IJJ40_00875 [Clostridia bacterium]|nr:hypothetical protein [Clostridia bacterium]